MRRLLFFLLIFGVAAAGHAAALSPTAQAEIGALLSRLEASSGTFNRKGTWYPPAEAKAHLLRKVKCLEDRGGVQSAEQFIARAGSNGSTTGQPYLVRCGNGAPVPALGPPG
jgi:hypothetical protein